MNLRETIARPRTRRVIGVLAALLALWTVVGFLVLPHFLRPMLERKLAQSLHRPVSIRSLSMNPFALSAALDGLVVKERRGAGTFLSLDRAYVNLESVSLFRRAPVLREIRVTNPSIHVVRNADGTYNFQDLIDESSKPRPAAEPVRFSLNNIRVEGGSVDFDDRLKVIRHTLRNVRIGIPFLSNIPSQVEITTQPVFQAIVNGAPFALHGRTKPFSPTRETTVELDLSDVDLPYYLAYAPRAMALKVTSGRFDAKITLSFSQPPGGTPSLLLSGASDVRRLAIERGGRPLLAWERFDAVVDSFDVLGRRLRVRSLGLAAPEVWVRRERTGNGRAEAPVAAAPAEIPRARTPAARPKETPGRPMPVEIAQVRIERGAIHYDDLAVQPPFHAVLADVEVSVRDFSNASGHRASLEVSAKTDAGETLKNSGTVSADPLTLEGALQVGALPLKRYAAFYGPLVRFDVDDGVLDLATKYRFSSGASGDTVLSDLTAKLRSPRLRKRGERTPFFQAPSVELDSSALDFSKREAALGGLSSAGGVLAVVREKNGDADITKLFAPPGEEPAPPPGPPSAPWAIALRKLALDGYTIRIDDRATERPARYALTKTDLSLEGFSTAPGKRAALSVRFGINGRGVASASGPVGIRPTYADLRADVKRLDLVPLEAYVLSDFRLSLARGSLTARGALMLREDRAGKSIIEFAGNALVSDFLAVDPETRLDIFKWDAFSLEGTKAGYNPTFLQVARLGITGLGCDIVIDSDGTVNLSRILGKGAPAAEEKESSEAAPNDTAEAPAAAVPESPTAAGAPSAPPLPAAPAPAGAPPNDRVPIRIDTLIVENGRIGLADHFIRPSYAATLGELSGHVTGLSTDAATVAQLDLRGTLANHSPLEISGRVNPLAASAFADVKGTFRDIDLPPFTPYAGKYAGYAIARGTLTMEVAYKLQNRKLSASNRLLVDQFELGEKVESKDATKLPVRLAVSLLKDKDGLIDLDLPIEGSLDDPKFRLGKVIWHVLGNLIGKAATAPFALLGKLLGGKGEELSSIDFADGRASLDDAARKKLDTLAKALNGRPALKLDVAGRVSEEQDSAGLRKLLLERRVKAQKLGDLARKGNSPSSVDAVVVDEKEYPTYLAKAYKKEKFQKPRNVLGIAKDVPTNEMEARMLQNLEVTPDDLRQLALARANAVKDDLTLRGEVDAARVFVVEPGEKSSAPDTKARASRADFVLK